MEGKAYVWKAFPFLVSKTRSRPQELIIVQTFFFFKGFSICPWADNEWRLGAMIKE